MRKLHTPSTMKWIDQLPLSGSSDMPDVTLTGWTLTPAGIQRYVQLASVLEPLVVTDGKTTRRNDCSNDQRFAYFMAAGVNIGEVFRALAARLIAAQNVGADQPLLYDLALQAQIASKWQRAGGRTNYGIISMLLPVVTSQILYIERPPDKANIGHVFECIADVMNNTTVEDAVALHHMELFAFQLSHYNDRLIKERRYSGKNVMEYYKAKYQGTRRGYYKELVDGLPVARAIVKEVLAFDITPGTSTEFHTVFSSACRAVLDMLPASYPAGLLADNTAVALYIVLSHYPECQIIH